MLERTSKQMDRAEPHLSAPYTLALKENAELQMAVDAIIAFLHRLRVEVIAIILLPHPHPAHMDG